MPKIVEIKVVNEEVWCRVILNRSTDVLATIFGHQMKSKNTIVLLSTSSVNWAENYLEGKQCQVPANISLTLHQVSSSATQNRQDRSLASCQSWLNSYPRHGLLLLDILKYKIIEECPDPHRQRRIPAPSATSTKPAQQGA